MKTLVIANQKGGVGKTSTLVHLAFYFVDRGKKVAIIDLDTQANASFTLSAFKSGAVSSDLFKKSTLSEFDAVDNMALIAGDEQLANLEKLKLDEAAGNFRASIERVAVNGFDICLIDTAPSFGTAMASALLAADYVASPIELEVYALQGIKKMHATITGLRQVNRNLKFLGMIPSKVDGRNPRHKLHLAELLEAYPALVMPTPIGNRSSIADALASHCPVWDIRKTSARLAAKEMLAMAHYIQEKMEVA